MRRKSYLMKEKREYPREEEWGEKILNEREKRVARREELWEKKKEMKGLQERKNDGERKKE